MIVLCATGCGSVAVGSEAAAYRKERHPQTTWAPCNRNAHNTRPSTFMPLTDAAAAALVTPEPEIRPDNDKPYVVDGKRYPATNYYVPSLAQVRTFRNQKDSAGQTEVQFNPYYEYVDGRDGLKNPSTDDLIQWAAHKWGIPENWLRAEYDHESQWSSFYLGDEEDVSGADYSQYPAQARVPNSPQVYQSMGITQIRWEPGNDLHAGTEQLRWESTAFNVDYQAATLRFYYDNPQETRTSWNDKSYAPCQQWNSLGAWFEPYPWRNSGQAQYVGAVKKILAQDGWRAGWFVQLTPTIPADVKLVG
jgi:hypothetical protein